MKYTKFTIRNYKGIPKIELDLSRKPSTNIFTLVGLNESGKTTVLEAIYLFQNGIPKDKSHSLIPKSQQHGFTGSISIEADLVFEKSEIQEIEQYLQKNHRFFLANIDNELSIKIEKRYSFVDSIPSEKEWSETLWSTSFLGKTRKAKSNQRLILWKKDIWDETINLIKKKYLPQILYYPDFLFKFPEKIYLEESSGEGKEQAEYRNVLGDILHSINPSFTLETSLLERMENAEERSYKDALEQLLLKMSSKLDEEILKKWDAIFGNGQKKEVNIKWDIEDGDEDKKRYFIELRIKQGSDSYSINDRSLGFRWFFSFLIFTVFRQARSTDHGETLFLLDEPASNLHQRSQQKLLQSLDGIVSDCKLVYSTHSHHLINPKWLAGTYIVKNKAINYGNPEESDTSETDIDAVLYKNFVAKHPDEEDHFKPILDALQYVPSKLEIVPKTIFTEGKNDYYTFKYILETCLGKNDLHFYPGAGVDKYDDVFRLYLAWDRDFISVFDSDLPGIRAKKRYINEIENSLSEKIFTLEDVDSKLKNTQTEQLFTVAEQIKIIQSVFEDHKKEDGYIKSKFNTAIQQLNIEGKAIGLSEGTKKKFEKIYDFIITKFQ